MSRAGLISKRDPNYRNFRVAMAAVGANSYQAAKISAMSSRLVGWIVLITGMTTFLLTRSYPFRSEKGSIKAVMVESPNRNHNPHGLSP